MNDHFHPLNNQIQHYAWGSHHALAELLGRPAPSPRPEAELWMGAHPKAPSHLLHSPSKTLLDLINSNPQRYLTPQIARKFNDKLPFLFKVLAIQTPLSIQAHPNLQQAQRGFERENQLDIPIDAPFRNYRDDNHKPELIVALTPFWLLKGFRSPPEIFKNFKKITQQCDELFEVLTQDSPHSLKTFFHQLMTLDEKSQKNLIDDALLWAQKHQEEDTAQWLAKLHDYYPYDIGVLSPLYLHLLQLQPDEALYLPAGELHAYLKGLGIELMANSDNVLRGGLTPKHKDIPELLKTLTFHSKPPQPCTTNSPQKEISIYLTPTQEFLLKKITLSHSTLTCRGGTPSIILCLEGKGEILSEHGQKEGKKIHLKKGESLFISANSGNYGLKGSGTFFKAEVPQETQARKFQE